MRSIWMKVSAALLGLCFSCLCQTVTGTLECRVTDASGGVLSGADVSVKSDDT